MAMKGLNIGKWSAEKISNTVLFSIVGVSAVVFVLFYLVGYNMPSMWNENVNSPLFTDLVILLMIALFVSAIVSAIYSKFLSLKKSHTAAVVNGINGKRITRFVVLGVMVVMVLSYILGSSDGILVNGSLYDNAVWLRVTNMFVVTSLLLIVFGVAVICYATVKNRRRR